MTLREFCNLAIVPFISKSTRRTYLGHKLLEIFDFLAVEKVAGHMWIDGSFLTEKPTPKDYDVLLRLTWDEYNLGSVAKKKLINAFHQNQFWKSHKCHSFVNFEFPRNRTEYAEWEQNRRDWKRDYQLQRLTDGSLDRTGKFKKGIAVVPLRHGGL